jgi:septum formation protein
LIRLLGYPFRVIAADIDESNVTRPDVTLHVLRTSQLKAQAVKAQFKDQPAPGRRIVVAADTIVALHGDILGKPADEADARRMLRALRDRTHHVFTGITLIDLSDGREVSVVHKAAVLMRPYGDEELRAYIATGDPMDKAGAYAIQHPLFQPVARLDGCYMGVMGLSVCHLIQALRRLEVPVMADMSAVYDAHNHYPCPLFPEIDSGA